MSKIVWDAIGERTFETGVDRGVLYVKGFDGVPWNGLINVSEPPSSISVTPHYVDGIKYHNQMGPEEFTANIEAFTYPDEFLECDGTASIKNGLYSTQQSRKQFDLSYRTKIGNDVKGISHGYKIHLVYNALASPSERLNDTISDSIEPITFNWSIFTKPPLYSGHTPTSHFVIDSRQTPSDLLNRIEDILYGNDTNPPRIPSVEELVFIFEEYEASVFDAGYLTDTYYITFDSDNISVEQTSTIDGGGP